MIYRPDRGHVRLNAPRPLRSVAQFLTKPRPVSAESADLLSQVCPMFAMRDDIVRSALEFGMLTLERFGLA
jgi:hypothetical protein